MSRFIRKLHLRNLLSFEDCEVELQDLNILIGPNGAGKSNLLETIGLLRSLVFNFEGYLNQGGGPAAWIWKGKKVQSAQVDTTLDGGTHGDLIHSFKVDAGAAGLRWEKLFRAGSKSDVFVREGDRVAISGTPSAPYNANESVFRHYKNPADPGPTTELGQRLESIRIYREFRTCKSDNLRTGFTGVDGNHLEEGGQNLALVSASSCSRPFR